MCCDGRSGGSTRYAHARAIMIITFRWHNLGMATSPDPISLDYGVWLARLWRALPGLR